MAQARYRTLSKHVVDRLSVNGKDTIFRDRDLAGFGVRVYPSEKKVFVVRTRAFGRSKRVTLADDGAPVWLKTGHCGPVVAYRRTCASVPEDIPADALTLERAPALLAEVTGRAPRPVHEQRHLRRLGCDRERAGVDAPGVEQIGDQPDHAVGLLVDDAEELARLGRREVARAAEHRGGRALDCPAAGRRWANASPRSRGAMALAQVRMTPWAGYAVTERVSVWGAAGCGNALLEPVAHRPGPDAELEPELRCGVGERQGRATVARDAGGVGGRRRRGRAAAPGGAVRLPMSAWRREAQHERGSS